MKLTLVTVMILCVSFSMREPVNPQSSLLETHKIMTVTGHSFL